MRQGIDKDITFSIEFLEDFLGLQRKIPNNQIQDLVDSGGMIHEIFISSYSISHHESHTFAFGLRNDKTFKFTNIFRIVNVAVPFNSHDALYPTTQIGIFGNKHLA